jgi:hypothetical protein
LWASFQWGDDRAGFINVVEGIHVEAFVAPTTVEGFSLFVAPRLPRGCGMTYLINIGWALEQRTTLFTLLVLSDLPACT